MILALFILPAALIGAAPSYTQTGSQTNGVSGVVVTQTNLGAVFSISNFGVSMPIYTFSPAPAAFGLSQNLSATGAVVYPTGPAGNEIVTAYVDESGRRVGYQFGISYPASVASNFIRFETNTLAYKLWTNCIGTTNGKSGAVWSSMTRGGSWAGSGLMQAGTNFTALSVSNDFSSGGQGMVLAVSRWLGYLRGHGFGPAGTNSDNAGKKIYWLTSGNGSVTNAISEQVTSLGFDADFTLVRFDAALPDTIATFPLVEMATLLRKWPNPAASPRPAYIVQQGNRVSCNLPAFPFGGYTAGDSGLPTLLLHSNRFVFVQGASTAGWSVTMSNAAVGLLLRGGLGLEHLPEIETFASYPDY